MKKEKSYLALKAVNVDGSGRLTSAFIVNPALKAYYGIGHVTTCKHPKFPLFVATKDHIDAHRKSNLAVSTTYDEILLISVKANDVKFGTPSLFEPDFLRGSDLSELDFYIKLYYISPNYVSAKSVNVLALVPKGEDLFAYLRKESKRRRIPILTLDKAKELGELSESDLV
jgi:hypothetical protein